MEIMHPESGEMIVLRVGKQILKRAFLKHEHPNRFETEVCKDNTDNEDGYFWSRFTDT